MRGHFDHIPGQGPFGYAPFGHHGHFEHHGPFGHHGHFAHHGTSEHPGHFGHLDNRCPGCPSGWSNGPCGQRGSGDCGFFGRPRRPMRPEGSHEPERCGRGRCDAREGPCHREQDQERRRGPHSPERHGQHGFGQDRGDHCRPRRPHDRSDDDEPSCCRRRDRSGERGPGPWRRGHRRHRSPGPYFGPPGPFEPRGPFGCGLFGSPGHCGPHHVPHQGRFGPMGRPEPDRQNCRRCCSIKDRAHNSGDESGNETEGRHGRRNKRNCLKNKDDNRETVLVQRIVVEKAPRCYSV